MERISMSSAKEFRSFTDFYPVYLDEHKNTISRRLHFIGTSCILLICLAAIFTKLWVTLWFVPVVGYGFAWVGHFVFEKNRPATFKHPIYSLIGDFKMWWQILIGKIDW